MMLLACEPYKLGQSSLRVLALDTRNAPFEPWDIYVKIRYYIKSVNTGIVDMMLHM